MAFGNASPVAVWAAGGGGGGEGARPRSSQQHRTYDIAANASVPNEIALRQYEKRGKQIAAAPSEKRQLDFQFIRMRQDSDHASSQRLTINTFVFEGAREEIIIEQPYQITVVGQCPN